MSREGWRAPKPFARIVLVLTGVVWFAIGLVGLLSPLTIAGWVGFLTDDGAGGTETLGAMGRLEVRAMYGGLCLALGVLHAIAASRAHLLRPGVWASLVLTAGLAAGRVLSIVLDAAAPAFGLTLLGAEVALIVLLTTAAVRLPRAQG